MNKYTSFFGIDIAKKDFVAALYGQKKPISYANNLAGFADFISQHQALLKSALVVLETTGGYEWDLMVYFKKHGIAIHRADTLKAKNFMKSLRRFGKTDAIDAQGLATYGYERHSSLKLFEEPEERQLCLQLLVRRRADLVSMRTQELNRSQSPMSELLPITTSFSDVLKALAVQIDAIDDATKQLVESDSAYKEKKEIMLLMPGVGEKTANKLLALVPELGNMTRRGIANISGVAPHPRDSGAINGYRKTRGGREDVKETLFMAALSAMRSKGKLGDYYRQLIARGKKGLVAMVALMRKMITILNAQIRNLAKGKDAVLPV